ncbi:glycosyltransferase family 39 protein [Methanoregula sp.]|uniref:glycosyltransferase family 39 protein n=1 Tax=Methanoregula sp. TaxID=2052170 RepID=UPI003C791070
MKQGKIRKNSFSAAHEAKPSGEKIPQPDNLPWQSRIGRYEIPLVFILAFLIFNTVSLVTITSSDVAPATFLPAAIILNHNFYFDFATSLTSDPVFQYAFLFENGHYVSLFPVVTPVLVTPVYFLSYAICNIFSLPITPEDFIILGKTSATILSAIATVIFYCAAKELFPKKTAVLTTFVFAIATPTWSISSQALWQTGMVELLLVSLVYLIIRNQRAPHMSNVVLMGVLSGLFFFNRPPDSLLLIPVIVYIFLHQKAKIPHFITGIVAGGLPFLLYNLFIFGNFLGGYKENLGRFIIGPGFIWNYAGLLIAPNVGILVFAPVLILSVIGFLWLKDMNNPDARQVLLIFGPVIALHILLYSFFDSWYSASGFCFGPRYLTGLIPVLCMYVGIFFTRVFSHKRNSYRDRGIQAAIAVLIVISVIIQVIGVLYYPYNPDKTMDIDRAWSLTNSLIVESYVTGSQTMEKITIYTLPPLPPLFNYRFEHARG